MVPFDRPHTIFYYRLHESSFFLSCHVHWNTCSSIGMHSLTDRHTMKCNKKRKKNKQTAMITEATVISDVSHQLFQTCLCLPCCCEALVPIWCTKRQSSSISDSVATITLLHDGLVHSHIHQRWCEIDGHWRSKVINSVTSLPFTYQDMSVTSSNWHW